MHEETGERGAEPKYTAETDKRILAMLDRPVPAGHGRWTPSIEALERAQGYLKSARSAASRTITSGTAPPPVRSPRDRQRPTNRSPALFSIRSPSCADI